MRGGLVGREAAEVMQSLHLKPLQALQGRLSRRMCLHLPRAGSMDIGKADM
jgi:hypothetical protein